MKIRTTKKAIKAMAKGDFKSPLLKKLTLQNMTYFAENRDKTRK